MKGLARPSLFLVPAVALGIAFVTAGRAGAQCSVFDRHPCTPTFCSVFHRRPCIPEIQYPFGQTLQLTITSTAFDDDAIKSGTNGSGGTREHKLDRISDMFAALRGCWIPPAQDDARPGMQMTVRLSFKRSGGMIGAPRVTYVSPGAPPQTRNIYHDAINAALGRCTPLAFTSGLGRAIAGRPIAIRFVDERYRK